MKVVIVAEVPFLNIMYKIIMVYKVKCKLESAVCSDEHESFGAPRLSQSSRCRNFWLLSFSRR